MGYDPSWEASSTETLEEPQIEHTRHRSLTGFMLNLLGGLVAYTYQDKKPSLNLDATADRMLPVIV